MKVWIRVRCNSSCITVNITDPGEKVPNVCAVFISKIELMRPFKITKEWENAMCEIVEEYANKTLLSNPGRKTQRYKSDTHFI